MDKYIHSLMTDDRNGIFDCVIKFILCILSVIYGFIVFIRNTLFDMGVLKEHALNTPVISIGNLSMGGSGKTPFVMYLAQYLLKRDKKVSILTRGYKSKGINGLSDEVSMLKDNVENIEVVVGKNRVKEAFEHLKHKSPDCFLMDDGFQHRYLKRDLNIVLINANEGFGNKWLIPRGVLREQISSLKRADICVLTKVNLVEENIEEIRNEIKERNNKALILEADYALSSLVDIRTKQPVDVNMVKPQACFALSAIGDPTSYKQMLNQCGFNIVKYLEYLDHYHFSNKDGVSISNMLKNLNCKNIIVTQKDTPKILEIIEEFEEGINIYETVMNVDIIKNKEEFFERINLIS